MFKKILIANRGAHAFGAVALATNRLGGCEAAPAGELTPVTDRV